MSPKLNTDKPIKKLSLITWQIKSIGYFLLANNAKQAKHNSTNKLIVNGGHYGKRK